MFIRKRVRHKESGPKVYFTALRSVRTSAGPRQQTVASWYSPADPAHPLYAPSVEKALELIEIDSFANVSPEKLRKSAEHWRDILRNSNGAFCMVPAIGGARRWKREAVEDRARYLEARAAEKEQQAEGLRTVLAEIGNWTWDGTT